MKTAVFAAILAALAIICHRLVLIDYRMALLGSSKRRQRIARDFSERSGPGAPDKPRNRSLPLRLAARYLRC